MYSIYTPIYVFHIHTHIYALYIHTPYIHSIYTSCICTQYMHPKYTLHIYTPYKYLEQFFCQSGSKKKKNPFESNFWITEPNDDSRFPLTACHIFYFMTYLLLLNVASAQVLLSTQNLRAQQNCHWHSELGPSCCGGATREVTAAHVRTPVCPLIARHCSVSPGGRGLGVILLYFRGTGVKWAVDLHQFVLLDSSRLFAELL